MKKEVQIFHHAPEDFNQEIQAAGCYVEVAGRLLLLKRSPRQSEAGLWGIPGGKLEEGESALEAVCRELSEEVAIQLDPTRVRPLGALYFRKPGKEYVFHLFHAELDNLPDLKHSPEHEVFLWATREEFLELPLMTGSVECLNMLK